MINHDPRSLLRQVFGYINFRGEQEAIIQQIIAGGDALVLMPTGGGKSLCYQIPALIRSGTAIVVSPLIALMQDQVAALLQLGVRAAALHSNLNQEVAVQVSRQLRRGELDLLYVAPERLLSERFLAFLDTVEVALFAIDEAHCVSQWGHDFRPEYTQLTVLHERYPNVPRIALTATADEQTRADIIKHLRLDDARIFIAGFDRPNIRYHVVQKNKQRTQLINFIQQEHAGEAGIVYCLSRKKTESIAEFLQLQGLVALPYHAGLTPEMRQYHQTRFIREEGVIMVATIAFGMGIDKPNVRFVAHLDLPKNMEAYYQETGRAGRDGLPANAWMTFGLEDVILMKKILDKSEANEAHKRLELHKLDILVGYCELTTCRRQALLGYFGDELPQPCGNCDNCLHPVPTWNGTEAAQKALSCIYRTGQYFGVNYLIDVLRGEGGKLKNPHHQQLSVFGIGKELEYDQWRSVFRQLVTSGYVTVDISGYGALHLTEKARKLLRGEENIYFRHDIKPAKLAKKQDRAKSRITTQFAGADQRLYAALRAKRLELAQAQEVPPYVIFHDSTLIDMVVFHPTTLEELGKISGIGQRKLNQYGKIFLDILDEFYE